MSTSHHKGKYFLGSLEQSMLKSEISQHWKKERYQQVREQAIQAEKDKLSEFKTKKKDIKLEDEFLQKFQEY